MQERWIVTALGQDRPGIVAGVTKVLYDLGCNLEDSAMTRLEGEFAIMLIFSTVKRRSPETLRRAFRALERGKLAVHLRRLTRSETRRPRARGVPYLISVYGADRPGIVYRVSSQLARAGVNITDVQTHRSPASGARKRSLYVMLLEVEWPAKRSVSALSRQLKAVAKRLKVQVTLRPVEADGLTEPCRQALGELFRRAQAAGLIEHAPRLTIIDPST